MADACAVWRARGWGPGNGRSGKGLPRARRDVRGTELDATFLVGHTPVTAGLPRASIAFSPTGQAEDGFGGEGDLTILEESDQAVIGTLFGQMGVDPGSLIFDEPPDSQVRGMFHACPSDGMPAGAPQPLSPRREIPGNPGARQLWN